MTNQAPAPQPDLRERIAEMFPCICTPPFEDGAHWLDCPACPTGFRQAVEKLVNEFVESEVTLLEQRDTEWRQAVSIGIGASWISVSEAPTFAARVSDDIADMVRRHDVALRTQRDRADQKIDELNLRLVGARRERDEAREKLARAKNAGACDVLLQIRSKLNEEQRSGRYRPVSEEMRDWLGNLDHEYKKALGAESPRKDAAEGQ